MDIEDADFAAGMGGPGAEDFANGAAALAAALAREAAVLAEAGNAIAPSSTQIPAFLRREGSLSHAGGLAAVKAGNTIAAVAARARLRAVLALAAGDAIAASFGQDRLRCAAAIAKVARDIGIRPQDAVPLIDAGVLALRTDDAAARMAAATFAKGLAELLLAD